MNLKFICVGQVYVRRKKLQLNKVSNYHKVALSLATLLCHAITRFLFLHFMINNDTNIPIETGDEKMMKITTQVMTRFYVALFYCTTMHRKDATALRLSV